MVAQLLELVSPMHSDDFKRKYTGWTEEQLQSAYERSLIGNERERVRAILDWSLGAAMSYDLPASRTGPRTRLDAFDYLRSVFHSECSTLLKDAAVRGIAPFFRGTCEVEVSQFLASIVVTKQIARQLRLRAYEVLWQVNEKLFNVKPKVQDSKRLHPVYPGLVGPKLSDLLSLDLKGFVERVNHFTIAVNDPGFSIEDQVNWDWVQSFVAG